MQHTIEDIQIGQIAQHYKGGLYRVTGFVQLEASNTPAVTYTSLDRSMKPVVWARAVDNFLEMVGESPRFTLHHTETDAGLKAAIPAFLLDPDAIEQILVHYDAANRYYHSRDHVLGMFNRAMRDNVVLTHEQALAILFHDVVYQPGAAAGVNEEASAQMVEAWKSRIGLSTVNVEAVKQIIRDTTSHTPTSPESPVVLDLDLMGLAGSYSEFQLAWELNRLEWAHLVASADCPEQEFDKARLRNLLQMCRSSRVFHSTRYGKDAYEDAFRENIERARQQWTKAYLT